MNQAGYVSNKGLLRRLRSPIVTQSVGELERIGTENKNSPTSTEVVTGPMVSNEDAYATSPCRKVPYVGFKPTTPQNDAGCLIEPGWRTFFIKYCYAQSLCIPPVSLPRAAAHCFRATADAELPEEPPGILHIPGITGHAKSRVFGRAAHAKFIKIRLSKYNASLRLHVAWKYWMLRSGNTLRNQGCTNLYSRDYQRTVWRSMRLWGYHNKKNWLLYFKSELSCFSCCPQLG